MLLGCDMTSKGVVGKKEGPHRGRLIKVDHCRIANQRKGHTKSPLHTSTELPHLFAPHVSSPQIDPLQAPLDFSLQICFLHDEGRINSR